MSRLEEEDTEQDEEQEGLSHFLLDNDIGNLLEHLGVGQRSSDSDVLSESFDSDSWGETHIGSGVIVRRWLSIPEIEGERFYYLSKFLERLKDEGKTGFHFSIANRTGTDRHEMAIDRLTWLLKHHATGLDIPAYGCMVDRPLEEVIQGEEERKRFNELDNMKKWQYRPDIYTFQSRIEDGKLIIFDRRLIEFDGGYHGKYKQKMKDEWKDHDTRLIFPDIKIIRFDVDEVVPETTVSGGDHCSTDLDLLRKFLTNRNYFSRPGMIDTVGKSIPEQLNLRFDSENAERRNH